MTVDGTSHGTTATPAAPTGEEIDWLVKAGDAIYGPFIHQPSATTTCAAISEQPCRVKVQIFSDFEQVPTGLKGNTIAPRASLGQLLGASSRGHRSYGSASEASTRDCPILVNIAATSGPIITTITAAKHFVQQLVTAILLALAIALAVNLVVFPVNSRLVVFMEFAGAIGLLRKTASLQKAYLASLESEDMFAPATRMEKLKTLAPSARPPPGVGVVHQHDFGSTRTNFVKCEPPPRNAYGHAYDPANAGRSADHLPTCGRRHGLGDWYGRY
ncbi:hypothetical protein B0H65DRAFT_588507 [Neurospora tetraspora]|uniref:Putative ER transporter 6TM N-terminal domain-containing protein n=1 Tax=Neurospora tetraspora TaxID=94610 RepID=A0AAE0JEZ6_9PEZI|nr:hypothetical protein B0H65DRAFT_588507 [Neurospora tetraspora]